VRNTFRFVWHGGPHLFTPAAPTLTLQNINIFCNSLTLVAALRTNSLLFTISIFLLLTAFGGFWAYTLAGVEVGSTVLSPSEASGKMGCGTSAEISTDEGEEEGVV
jgi:hypothetical protein